MEQSNSWKHILFTAVIIILIIGTAWFTFRKTHPTDTTDHPDSERIQKALQNPKTADFYKDLIPEETTSSHNPGFNTIPNFQIGRYTVATDLPRIPGQTQVYTFKTSFPPEETQKLAKELLGSTATIISSENNIQTYSNEFGYFALNTQTGTFSMNSAGLRVPFIVPRNTQDIRPQLTSYLRDTLGIIDHTVTLTAFFQRNTTEGITEYEFHRDPEKIGLNIINPIGAANLNEDSSLADTSLSTFSQSDAIDQSIIFASDAPGKARRADFNTLTVSMTDDGHIVSIESTLRPLEKSEPLSNLALSVLTPEQALEELQNRGTYFNVTIPSGEGVINFDKVYYNNLLQTEEAVITDMTLTFMEKPSGITQKYLQPVYIVRGYAETNTGVRVKFAQTIPAIEDLESIAQAPVAQALGMLVDALVPNAFAQDTLIRIDCGDGTTQECTWEKFKNTPTPQPPTPGEVTPRQATPPIGEPTNPIPTPEDSDVCVIYNVEGTKIEDGQPIFIPGVGTVYYFANLSDGPLVVKNEQRGRTVAVSGAFQRKLEDELKSIGAQIIKNDPSKITYRNDGTIDLKALYNLDVDIQGTNQTTISGQGSIHTFNRPQVYYYAVHSALANAVRGIDNETRSSRGAVGLSRIGESVDSLASLPTPLKDSGLSNQTIWMSRRQARQFGITSRTYNDIVIDERCQPITTVSPLVYIYPETETDIRLEFNHDNIAYLDPYMSDTLEFTAKPSGKLTFGTISRDRVHYEYSHVSLNRPQFGWNIHRSELNNHIKKMGQKIGLNQQEIKDLLKDIKGDLIGKDLEEKVFVGLVDQSILDELLPMSFAPSPQNIHRVHVYIGSVQSHIENPTVEKLDRNGFTIIELGVYVE